MKTHWTRGLPTRWTAEAEPRLTWHTVCGRWVELGRTDTPQQMTCLSCRSYFQRLRRGYDIDTRRQDKGHNG